MKKALVAYFSASGVTAKLAERLADAIGADLSEIEPKARYTSADLDWRNKQSRSSVEMNDRSCRPEINRTVDDMAQYDVVFVGFPVWWYREPSIIDTFMAAYDSAANLQMLAAGAKIATGRRFDANTSADKLADWAKQWL